MTWTKLSDDFGDDCWTLSDAAFRLHVEGLGWSNRKLLDCRVPVEDLRRFAKREDALGELVDRDWWRLDSGLITVRHHAGYQRLAAEVLAQQERSRANGAKGGRPSKRETQPGIPAAHPARNPEGRDGTGQALDGRTPLELVRDAGTWPPVAQIPGEGA